MTLEVRFKMAKGALAQGPKLTRVSAGVYRDANGRLVNSSRPNQTRPQTGGGVKQGNPKNNPAQQQPIQNQPANPQTDSYNNTLSGMNQGVQNAFNQYQNQGNFNYQGPQAGTFNPGDYQQQFDASYQNAMSRFNRTMQPEFERQTQDFRQMAAERGWDPSSNAYSKMYEQQVLNPQEQARQGAMEGAFSSGLQGQAQAYGQSSNTYGQNLANQQQGFNQYTTQFGAPLAGLSAMSPYFGAQAQGIQQNDNFNFLGGQNALDRQQQERMAQLQNKYALQQIAAAPRGGGGGGGGGLTLADQIALQNNQFYNNMVLSGMQNGQTMLPNAGSGFAQGIGAGAGATIGSTLR